MKFSNEPKYVLRRFLFIKIPLFLFIKLPLFLAISVFYTKVIIDMLGYVYE